MKKKVSKKVIKNAPMLMALSQVKRPVAKSMIAGATKDQVEAAKEVCHNIIRGNVALSNAHLQRFRGYRRQLEDICHPRSSIRTKKKALQHGGFLSLLMQAIPAIVGGIGSLFKK